MPPKSKKQRRAAAIAKKVKEGKVKAIPGSASAEMAKSMSKNQLHDFAAHSEKKLPERKKTKKRKPKKV